MALYLIADPEAFGGYVTTSYELGCNPVAGSLQAGIQGIVIANPKAVLAAIQGDVTAQVVPTGGDT
jgi:hypothetical protein